MKKLGKLFLAIIVTLFIAIPTYAKTLSIGVSFQEMNNQYFVVMKDALQKAVDSIGAKLYVTDASHDIVKQVNDIEDLVNKKIDILILNPTDSKGIINAVEYAKKHNIVVVSVDAQAEGPIDSFVGSKNYDAGYSSCLELGKELDKKGDVAILDGIPVVPILERVRGCKEALKKFPKIKIVDMQNGKQDRNIAIKVTENMLQAHPNLNGIFSVNDGGSMGVLAAIESSGKKVILASVDGAPEAIDAIMEDGAFKITTAQFPRDMVRLALGIALAKYWGAYVPKDVPLDVKLLTKKNAKGFSW